MGDYDLDGLRLADLHSGDGSLWQRSKGDTDSHNIHQVLGGGGSGLAQGGKVGRLFFGEFFGVFVFFNPSCKLTENTVHILHCPISSFNK